MVQYRYSYMVINRATGDAQSRSWVFQTFGNTRAWEAVEALRVKYSSLGYRLEKGKLEAGKIEEVKQLRFVPTRRIKKPVKVRAKIGAKT